MSAAKRLSEAMIPGTDSALGPAAQRKISQAGTQSAQGFGSDEPGQKAGFKRTLSQQQVTRMAAELEERGRQGMRRFVNPRQGRAGQRSNHAYAITNEGGYVPDMVAAPKQKLSNSEKIARHDERWRFDPASRIAVGVKVYGR